jgi:hypothetical protein
VVETLEQRTLETIERSRALLALSGERLNRQEAAVMRVEARRERHQAEIYRASAEGERKQAVVLPDPSKAIERAKALRKRARTAMEALAGNEDEIARVHELLAARRPEQRDEYRRIAEQARMRARRVRENLRAFPNRHLRLPAGPVSTVAHTPIAERGRAACEPLALQVNMMCDLSEVDGVGVPHPAHFPHSPSPWSVARK